jgi:FAD/FMN-containing dehydrogenase
MTPATPTEQKRIWERAVRSLSAGLNGQVITPLDRDYGEARRVWNGIIDRYPALVVRCGDAAAVAAAIRFARDHGLPLAVRGGGHSAPGFGVCDGGVVADLSPMRSVVVDPSARQAWVGGGALWADVDGQTQTHGLAVTGGLVTHTGVGGLALGGGIGHLMRRCGLTCDNLTAADLVTADGELIHVGERAHEDLLWGLRGGGGNFGVVTRFRFRLHPVGPTVLAGAVLYPLDKGVEILRRYREWVADVPDDLTTVVALRSAPQAPFVPPEFHGEPVVAVAVCWSGPLDEGEKVVSLLRSFPGQIADAITYKPYLEHQHAFDASAPHGRHHYKKNANLPALSDQAIDTLIECAQARTSAWSVTLIFQLGGAVGRVAEDGTAYSDRAAAFNVDIDAQWDRDDARSEDHIAWVRNCHKALLPFTTGGSYVNFLMGDEGADRVRLVYGHDKYERLVTLKHRYDPGNVFQLNQNIAPPS